MHNLTNKYIGTVFVFIVPGAFDSKAFFYLIQFLNSLYVTVRTERKKNTCNFVDSTKFYMHKWWNFCTKLTSSIPLYCRRVSTYAQTFVLS